MVREKYPRPSFSSKKRSHVITVAPIGISVARGANFL
jgi:hypothetical protein